MSTEISVALVYQHAESSAALRAALANAGVRVAIESRADAIDSASILNSGVDAIVVNLDSELDDLLDQVTEALDSATQPVIFNDPEASSDLSGWDRARWMRHLSAKLKGGTNVTPPAPPDAKGIPSPKRTPPQVTAPAPVATSAAKPAAVIVAETVVAPQAASPSVELGDDVFASIPELQFDAPSELPITREVPIVKLPAADAVHQDVPLDEFLFGPSPTAAPPPASSQTLTVGDDLADLDALFAEPVDAAPQSTDIDPALFEAPAPLVDVTQPGPISSTELADLDALFAELAPETAVERPAPPVPAAASNKPKVVEAPMEWSLEPVDIPEVVPTSNIGKTVAEWRLDAPAKPLAVEREEAAKAPAKPAEKTLPPEFEASLAMADLKLLDDEITAAASAPASPGADDFSIDSLDFNTDFGFDTPAAAPVATAADEIALSDLDFALDFSADESSAGNQALTDDFDGLFESNAPTPVFGLSLPDLSRVYVLGASIGGPESIKAFLAGLPANTAAAFIVAQHMGAEFLEMMAMQLDGASKLSVRYPKSGERLKHGEVIVAPAGEELKIDDSGCIRLSPAQSNSPYSPSIDQIVRDVADRFGDQAKLVLFSGMGGDAVEGARYLAQRGGEVWVQDRKSCVIATMIEAAKAQGVVRFEGSPAELAERVLSVLS